jgi:Na+(H+)/acetate symporter ActP
VTVIIAITYATAQFKGIGLICGWIFGMDYTASVFFAAGVTLAYLLISGMVGVTRNQQIQYVVLISAFLIPSDTDPQAGASASCPSSSTAASSPASWTARLPAAS